MNILGFFILIVCLFSFVLGKLEDKSGSEIYEPEKLPQEQLRLNYIIKKIIVESKSQHVPSIQN
jgi:hypothetical protein